MSYFEENKITEDEANMSAYRFLAGAQCTEEDLETVRSLIRCAALMLVQPKVAKAAHQTVKQRISTAKDLVHAEMWDTVLSSCGVLCEAVHDCTKSSREKGLS